MHVRGVGWLRTSPIAVQISCVSVVVAAISKNCIDLSISHDLRVGSSAGSSMPLGESFRGDSFVVLAESDQAALYRQRPTHC